MNYRKIIPYVLLILVAALFFSFYTKRDTKTGDAQQNARVTVPASPNVTAMTQEQSQYVQPKIDRSEIESIIADFISRNPKLIVESVSQYAAAQRPNIEQGVDVSGKVEMLKDKLFSNQTPRVGNPAGRVKVVEFFDYACKFCRSMLDTKLKILSNNPDVEIFFKEVPVVSEGGSFASTAAIATYITDNNMYFPLHQALLEFQGVITQDIVFGIAKKLGMDTTKLKESMENSIVLDALNSNKNITQELGIEAAPTYIIGGKMYFGTLTYDVMQDLINKARAAADSQVPAPQIANDNAATAGSVSVQSPEIQSKSSANGSITSAQTLESQDSSQSNNEAKLSSTNSAPEKVKAVTQDSIPSVPAAK